MADGTCTHVPGFTVPCSGSLSYGQLVRPARFELALPTREAGVLPLDDGHEGLGRQDSNLHLPGNSRAPSHFGHIPMVAGTESHPSRRLMRPA